MALVKVKFNVDTFTNGKVFYGQDVVDMVLKHKDTVFEVIELFGEYDIEIDGKEYSFSEDSLIILDTLTNNYHCLEKECYYKTNAHIPGDAEVQLLKDGGYDVDKKTMCPSCKKDSLVFVPDNA